MCDLECGESVAAFRYWKCRAHFPTHSKIPKRRQVAALQTEKDIRMNKLFLEQLPVQGKRVLVRVDFNVPLDDGQITDDLRIRESLPTIRWLREHGARTILMSHMGRPKGKRKPEESLAPVARRLGELLGIKVPLAPDCVGTEVEELVKFLN